MSAHWEDEGGSTHPVRLGEHIASSRTEVDWTTFLPERLCSRIPHAVRVEVGAPDRVVTSGGVSRADHDPGRTAARGDQPHPARRRRPADLLRGQPPRRRTPGGPGHDAGRRRPAVGRRDPAGALGPRHGHREPDAGARRARDAERHYDRRGQRPAAGRRPPALQQPPLPAGRPLPPVRRLAVRPRMGGRRSLAACRLRRPRPLVAPAARRRGRLGLLPVRRPEQGEPDVPVRGPDRLAVARLGAGSADRVGHRPHGDGDRDRAVAGGRCAATRWPPGCCCTSRSSCSWAHR